MFSNFDHFPGSQADPRHLRVHGGFVGHEVDARRRHQGRSEATSGGRNPEGTRSTSHRSTSQCAHLQSESKGE